MSYTASTPSEEKRRDEVWVPALLPVTACRMEAGQTSAGQSSVVEECRFKNHKTFGGKVKKEYLCIAYKKNTDIIFTNCTRHDHFSML